MHIGKYIMSKKQSIKGMFKKKRDIGIPVAIFIIEIILSIFLYSHAEAIIMPLENSAKSIESLCNLIITYGSIMVAIFVLCYSILDLKRLGVSNRTCLRYMLGNITLPLLFIWIMIKIPVIYILNLYGNIYMSYTGIIIVLLEEFLIIVFIVAFSSMKMTIKAIEIQEKWQFRNWFKKNSWYNYILSPESVTHIRKVMESDDFFSDKSEVIKRIIKIPINEFNKTNGHLNGKEWTIVYNYYYENAYCMFTVVKESQDEKQKVYNICYEALNNAYNANTEISEDEYDHIIHLAVAAVMDAAVMSSISEAEEFCTYILNLLYERKKDVARIQTVYFVLMLQLLFEKSKNFNVKKFKLNKIDKLPDSVSIDKHIQELLIYWHLIVNNSTIETENIDKIFYNTISSLKGESNTAIIALYLIKRKDSNNI